MDLSLRPIVADELPAFMLTDEYGFGFRRDDPEAGMQWAGAELDRTIAAFDGDEVVGTGRNYSLELTMPGGATLPASGVSWIAVRPTHRRHGVLSSMMSYLVEEGARRGEAASILTASEGSIYGRFGFGVATRVLSIRIERSAASIAEPVTAGRVRLIEPEECAKVAPELFERVRASRPGAVSRPAVWWVDEWVRTGTVKNRFDVIFELDGRIEGYAVYGIDGIWGDGFSDKTVSVRDLIAATPQAEAALWQYLCSIDLVSWIAHFNVTPDTELPWLLRDSRQVRTTSWRDWLWLRPVDAPALLAARRYGTAGRLVLDVRDGMRPEGEAAGRFLLEGGPDGASCVRTGSAPDLVLDVDGLGAISLGGLTASVLARAGRIEERVPGALARADGMFAADRSPHSFTWF